ncbi:hypothetical protein FA15DRAFT_412289 [Coprinopsis marcescibilis]|uniref:F-box domain-containing protein n=1 Tax=Coprinopsis marcescibilis TaxID=230819 RepID=A0A5C3KVA8_COPMA|nr:hypothetical protein FA15DRAFT_412289 [Coprinopsis marcescibilis]
MDLSPFLPMSIMDRSLPSLPPTLRHSSTIPTDSDVITVQRTIASSKRVLKGVDEEIERLQASLASARARRDKVQEHIAEHESVLSPLRYLPPEILEEIFLYVAEDAGGVAWPNPSIRPALDNDKGGRVSEEEVEAEGERGGSGVESVSEDVKRVQPEWDVPWKLGKVCSYWRTVFVSSSKLWASFRIDLTQVYMQTGEGNDATRYSYEAVYSRAHGFLETCLERAGNQPLTFTFRYQPPSNMHSFIRQHPSRSLGPADVMYMALYMPKLLRSLLVRLTAVSMKWESVSLELGLRRMRGLDRLLGTVFGKLPKLKRLHLAADDSPGQNPYSIMQDDEEPYGGSSDEEAYTHGTTGRPLTIRSFSLAPNLTHLTIVNLAQPMEELKVPWRQLRYLRSRGTTFQEGEFSRILKACGERLEEFVTEDERVLEVANDNGGGTGSTPIWAPWGAPHINNFLAMNGLNAMNPIVNGTDNTNAIGSVQLPRLHTLSVTNKGSYISRIFQLLTAPSFTALSIVARTQFVAEPIVTMLHRSNAASHTTKILLETASYSGSLNSEAIWEDNYGVVKILSELENVRECVLRVSRAVDGVVPWLAVPRSASTGNSTAGLRSGSSNYSGSNTSPWHNPGGNPNGGDGLSRQLDALRLLDVRWNGTGGGTLVGSGAGIPYPLPNLRDLTLCDSCCENAVGVAKLILSRIEDSNACGVDAGAGTDGAEDEDGNDSDDIEGEECSGHGKENVEISVNASNSLEKQGSKDKARFACLLKSVRLQLSRPTRPRLHGDITTLENSAKEWGVQMVVHT